MRAAIETYRIHIFGQTKTVIYKAVKDDHIDIRIAEYINNYPG